MLRHTFLKHCFVHYIPEQLEPGTIYISIDYATAVHICCCGCGEQVVTPFNPTDWKLIFDGETISLYPSIGNWKFKCRSHYWINKNIIEWCHEENGRTDLPRQMFELDKTPKLKEKKGGSFFRRLFKRK